MKLPYLRAGVAKSQRTVGQWGGVDERLIIDDSSLASMKNMSTRFYPAIGTRPPRSGTLETISTPRGLYSKNGLFWISGTQCYYAEDYPENEPEAISGMTVTAGPKQVVGMGAYICVFPDKLIFNTNTKEVTAMDASWFQNGIDVVISELTTDSVYARIRGSHISDNFKKGDGITLAGIDHDSFLVDGQPATKLITEVGENYLVVNAPIQDAWTGKATFSASGNRTRISGAGIGKYALHDVLRVIGCMDDALNHDAVEAVDVGTTSPQYILINSEFPSKSYTQTTRAVTYTAYYEGSNLSRIYADDMGETFTAGDVVTISGAVKTNDDPNVYESIYNGSFEVKQAGTNYILIEVSTDEKRTQARPEAGATGLSITRTSYVQTGVTIKRKSMTISGTNVQIRRKSPDMDFVCEHGNRLWGCSSANHEIYACKLGDPTNWSCYEGISTDSYTVTVGSDGDFTGCCAHMGYVLFFKEQSISVMYGDKPSNFQLSIRQMPGVREGCEKSLCVVDETLYYVGRDGVYQYDGAAPKKISDNILSDLSNAVAGQQDGKLYLSCQKDGEQTLLVYDPRYQIWDIEDNALFQFTANHNGKLYFITWTGILKTITGDDTSIIEWSIESGDLRENRLEQKWISKALFNLWLDAGSEADIYFRFDEDPIWHRAWTVHSVTNKTYSIPIVPQRCSKFRWRIEGRGQAKLLAMGITVEGGSEINGSIQSWERY